MGFQDKVILGGLIMLFAVFFASIIDTIVAEVFSDPLVMGILSALLPLIVVGGVVVDVILRGGDELSTSEKVKRERRRMDATDNLRVR